MVIKHAYFTHSFHSTLLLNELSHVTQYLIKGTRVIGKYNCPYWKLIGCLIFLHAAVLKILTYYAQYYAHVLLPDTL